MFCEKTIEGGEVSGFLIVHMLHEVREVRVRGHYGWSLGGVDMGCCKFAGLVDTQGGSQEVLLGLGHDSNL